MDERIYMYTRVWTMIRLNVFACMYMKTYMCIYAYKRIHLCICTCVCACLCVFVHTDLQIHFCVSVSRCVCMSMCLCLFAYVYIHVYPMCIHLHSCIHTHIPDFFFGVWHDFFISVAFPIHTDT